jgi:lysylphosphatidylglycerol synthetase-like protein (DUF2156 family)
MHSHIPVHDWWWLAAGAGYGARYVTHRFRLMRRPPLTDPDSDLLRLQSLYGYNAHSLVSLAPGALAWQMDGIDGAVIYNRFGHVWLAAGDPLVGTDDLGLLVKGFMDAARRDRCVAAFVPGTERFAHEAAALGMTAIKIGSAPFFDLQSWQPRGNCAKKLRAGINQATRVGVTIETVESLTEELKTETAELCRLWLKSRRAATTFGWLLALDPLVQAERKRFFAARDAEGRLVGFLAASPIPARQGWYLEDVLRHPQAPQGSTDLLVYEALRQLKAEGAVMATLGTAALAKDGTDEISTNDHPVIERALATAAKRFGAFYNFEGLRRFKAKFVPCWWESEYVLIQHGVMVPTRVAHALLKAMVPGGLTQLLTRQAVRSLKHYSQRSAAGSH